MFSFHERRENRSQERQYVKLSFALSVKEARGGRCEKYRFIKIKQHKEVISVSLQKSQEIYLILRNIISRSLPIYCLIIHFLKSLKRYLVSVTNRISSSDLRISVCSPQRVAADLTDFITSRSEVRK